MRSVLNKLYLLCGVVFSIILFLWSFCFLEKPEKGLYIAVSMILGVVCEMRFDQIEWLEKVAKADKEDEESEDD